MDDEIRDDGPVAPYRRRVKRRKSDRKRWAGRMFDRLTHRERRFVVYFCVAGPAQGNAEAAATAAGYRQPGNGARLLANPDVVAALQEYVGNQDGMGARELVQRLTNLARTSQRDLMKLGPDGLPEVDHLGNPKYDLKRAAATGALDYVESIRFTDSGPEVKLMPRMVAMKLLTPITGLATQRLRHEIDYDRIPTELLEKLHRKEITADQVPEQYLKALPPPGPAGPAGPGPA